MIGLSKENLKIGLVFLLLSVVMILVTTRYHVINDEINALLAAIGVSLLTTSFVNIFIYMKEFNYYFYKFLFESITENNNIADALTDFVYDIRVIDNTTEALERIVKLYDEVHSFDSILSSSFPDTVLFGNKKKAYNIMYYQKSQAYVKLLDDITKRRYEAVNLQYKSINECQQCETIRRTGETMNKYTSIFLEFNKDVCEIMELSAYAETHYKPDFDDIN